MMDYPLDIHFQKPDYSAEWWYLTGQGHYTDGEKANFHYAFFRKHSKTLGRDFWFAHHGVYSGTNFRFKRKFDLNHSGASPTGCYVGDWAISDYREPLVFRSDGRDMMLARSMKGPVWHDDQYYSITDMDLRGTLLGKDFRGQGWFDHSFFDASVKELLKLKYTWIALQLYTGVDIMVQWSSRKPHFLGTIVYLEGKIQGGNAWKIKQDEARLFQGGWRLTLPRHGIDIDLVKTVENRIPGNPEPGYIEGILDFSGGTGYFEIAEGNTNSIL